MKLIQRFRMISVCVAAAAAFTAIGMQAAPQRVVTAEEFRLTDRDGRIRARLVSTDEAGVALYLISAEGQLRGVLGVDAKGRPSLRLFNTANVPGLRLTVDTETPDSRPSVEMTYGDGTPALSILAMERNGLGIQGFGGGTKEPALDIQVVPKGLGKVALRSGDGSIQLMVAPGIQRISAGASKETKGVQIDTSGTLNGIRVFDDAGRDKIRLDVIKGEARVDVAKDEK